MQEIDNKVLNFILYNLRNSLLDNVMVFITALGNIGFIWIVISIIFLFSKKYRKYGMCILLLLLIGAILCDIIMKPMIGKIRPCNVNINIPLLINRPTSYSFPSGHSMSSFAAATIIFMVNKRCGIFAYIFAFLVAFSRLYLYVHYPIDVVCGGLIGIILAIMISYLFNFRNQNKCYKCI